MRFPTRVAPLPARGRARLCLRSLTRLGERDDIRHHAPNACKEADIADLAAIEARIWSLLEPYRGQLEPASIYGIPSLRWPGAKAHDYFAGVKSGSAYVSLYLLVADTYPDALEGASPALMARRSGKATFRFPSLTDELADELAALLARLFDRYGADHAGA